MLLKAPPTDPLRWRLQRVSTGGSPLLRGAGARAALPSPTRAPLNGGGRREEADDSRAAMPPPPPPPVREQKTQAPALSSGALLSPARSLVLPESLENAVGVVDDHSGPAARRSSSFDLDSNNGDESSVGWRQRPGVSDAGSEDQGEPPASSLPESAASSFRNRGQDDRGTAGRAESKSSWNENPDSLALRSSADESVRERMAKFGARQRARQLREQRQTLSHVEDLYGASGVSTEEAAGVGATADSNRPLIRAPGSWTSGIGGGTGPGGVRSPRLMRGGSVGGSNSLGSPSSSSSSNLVVTQAALGNLTNNLASLMSTNSQITSGNRESRRQSISRRLTRGASLGTGRLLAKEAADLEAVEEAEAVALGASPVAARAAADAAAAAAAETLAIRRRVVEERHARRRSRGRGMEGQERGYADVSPARGGSGGGGGGMDAIEMADAVLESEEEEEYATQRERRGSPESVASTSSAGRGRRQQQGGEPSAAGSDGLRGHGGGGGGGGTGFFGQQAPDSRVRKSRQSSVATPVSLELSALVHSTDFSLLLVI